MGAFALIRKDAPDADLADRLSAVLQKRGFPVPRRIETRQHILLLADKIVSPTPNFFSDESGDFVAVTGTLFYRASFGLQALAHLLADAKAERIDEAAFFGSFAVIIRNGLKLMLFGDGLGTYKIYKTADNSVWSSSFLACLSSLEKPRFDHQGVYEYVFNGACFGGASLVRDIAIVGPEHQIRLEPSLRLETRDLGIELSVSTAPLESHVEETLGVLRRHYAAITTAFGDQVDTALSGGYDSRLTLALLRSQGSNPHIHVYGGPRDADVQVAQKIASGEGFRLVHADKDALGDPSPEGVAAAAEAQFWAFDGWPSDGVIGSGSDLATRRARTEGGVLALNGGGGEIFRNFFYLPPRSFTIRELVWTFYNQFDPKVARAPFSEQAYNKAMEQKIAAIFPNPHRELTRIEIEYVYPGFRGRFWTGLNTSLNNAFGPALTPFFDLSVVREALRVPMRFKNHGIYEAALIAAVDPRLAGYMSAYGHDFIGEPPLQRRLADWATYLRPPLLRRLSYRLKTSIKPFEISKYFQQDYRQLYLPGGTPVMDRFFDLSAMRDNEQINRLLTLELLAAHMGIS